MQDLMPPINTPDKLFHDGDPSQGIEGTIVSAEFMNNEQGAVRDTQRELINVLAAASMEPNPAKSDQILTALRALFLSAEQNGADIPDVQSFIENLGLQYSISEPDAETVVYTLPGGYKVMVFNRLVNNSTTIGTGVTTPITFPQSFPSRLIAVFATKKNYVQAAVSCENHSLTGFDAVVTLITSIAGSITSTRAMFLAIGR